MDTKRLKELAGIQLNEASNNKVDDLRKRVEQRRKQVEANFKRVEKEFQKAAADYLVSLTGWDYAVEDLAEIAQEQPDALDREIKNFDKNANQTAIDYHNDDNMPFEEYIMGGTVMTIEGLMKKVKL